MDNSFEFTYEGITFPKGHQELNGELSLKYLRMRYDEPDGDYGRQERQHQILKGIVKQVLSTKSLTNYQSILRTIGNNVKTDLSFKDMRTLMGSDRSTFSNINLDQMKGESFTQDAISYQQIAPTELKRVQYKLKTQLK